MKTTYAKAAGSCIALSVLILAAFVLTGCQSAAEWRATQEGWATRDGLICDASLSPNPVVEHAQEGVVAQVGDRAAIESQWREFIESNGLTIAQQ